jgi:hypothetical protein
VLQRFAYARLYNLYLDPKETHNYMTRKLAYVEAFQSRHPLASGHVQRYPPKKVMDSKPRSVPFLIVATSSASFGASSRSGCGRCSTKPSLRHHPTNAGSVHLVVSKPRRPASGFARFGEQLFDCSGGTNRSSSVMNRIGARDLVDHPFRMEAKRVVDELQGNSLTAAFAAPRGAAARRLPVGQQNLDRSAMAD